MRDLSGVLLPPPFVVTDRKSQDDGILQRMWLTVCGSAFLPTSPSLDFPPLYFTTPGHFLAQLDGQRLRNLPVGHDVLSFFFFFLTKQNKTKKTLDNGVWLIYLQLRDRELVGMGELS